jgi:hypothetical protein
MHVKHFSGRSGRQHARRSVPRRALDLLPPMAQFSDPGGPFARTSEQGAGV